MEQRDGIFIFLGLIIGAVFGMGLGAANGNVLMGIGLGALAGTFIGWFGAMAAYEQRTKKK